MPHFCGDFFHDFAFLALCFGDWAVFALLWLKALALRARSTAFWHRFFPHRRDCDACPEALKK
jgi:hypothetical protein